MNVGALLDVLAAANPMRYAGRDPTASEFLVTAAATIRRDGRAACFERD